MGEKVRDLYDDYQGGILTRREFITRLAVARGAVRRRPTSLMISLGNNYARAEIIPKDDKRIDTKHLVYQGASGEVPRLPGRSQRRQESPLRGGYPRSMGAESAHRRCRRGVSRWKVS